MYRKLILKTVSYRNMQNKVRSCPEITKKPCKLNILSSVITKEPLGDISWNCKNVFCDL